MDDGRRGPEAGSLNDSHFSDSEEAASYRFDARDRTGLAPSRTAQYWLPAKNATMSIAIVDRHSFTRECIAKSLQECDDALVVSAFDTCDSCLECARTYDLVLYHAHGTEAHGTEAHGTETHRRNGGEARRAPFAKLLEIAPVVVLSDVDCPNAILDAFECGARGYIPTADTTLGLALEIVRLVRAGGTFVPPSSLALRRTSRRDPPPAVPDIAEPFTPRQMAVLRQVKLGKANKMIARELEMSESTVKIHLRNIMKKMKAANRTEVACRAHALEATRPSVTTEGG